MLVELLKINVLRNYATCFRYVMIFMKEIRYEAVINFANIFKFLLL